MEIGLIAKKDMLDTDTNKQVLSKGKVYQVIKSDDKNKTHDDTKKTRYFSEDEIQEYFSFLKVKPAMQRINFEAGTDLKESIIYAFLMSIENDEPVEFIFNNRKISIDFCK